MFQRLKNVLNRIVAWQKRPIQVAESVTEEAVCKNCGEHFHSSFCPRCGQSRNTPRLGSNNAIRIFLDTWGLGTNGLLRTIWHLISRPGYMIGDYIDGRRQLYFPPFKTLFVVGTIFALLFAFAGGFSEEAAEYYNKKKWSEELEKVLHDAWDSGNAENAVKSDARNTEIDASAREQFDKDSQQLSSIFYAYTNWREHNRVTDQLLTHIVFAVLALYIFRKSPRRPGMNFAENVIAQVYICAQMGVVALFIMLVSLPFSKFPTGDIPEGISLLLFFYDYKQLYGYGVWRTAWKTLLMHIIFFALIFILTLSVIMGIFIHSLSVA